MESMASISSDLRFNTYYLAGCFGDWLLRGSGLFKIFRVEELRVSGCGPN